MAEPRRSQGPNDTEEAPRVIFGPRDRWKSLLKKQFVMKSSHPHAAEVMEESGDEGRGGVSWRGGKPWPGMRNAERGPQLAVHLDEPNEQDLIASCPVLGMRAWEESPLSPLILWSRRVKPLLEGQDQGRSIPSCADGAAEEAMGMGPAFGKQQTAGWGDIQYHQVFWQNYQ